jgi:GxxExxY protein
MTENEVAKQIVDVAFKIHTTFGPGLLESVYETIMAYELQKRGLQVIRQQAIPVVYESIRMDIGFRADLIVENRVVVEIKSVEAIAPVHKKQLLTYLRLTDKRLGLLINFNVDLIKEGITRVVNGL